MEKNRPWQIYALSLCYLLDALYIIRLMYYQVNYKKSILNISVTAILVMVFTILVFSLFRRHPWSYKLNIVLLIPISICSIINILLLIFIPSIWTYIMPITMLLTIYGIFSKPTRSYFGIKNNK